MEFQIGTRRVGAGHPVYIIAEGCDNHLGNLDTAKEMALRAKLADADAIKFQHHLPDEEMLPDIPMSDNFNMPLYEFLKKYALTLQQHVELKAYCESIGIQYMCTPFSWKAAQELHEIGLQSFKIGSGEMTDLPSLNRIAQLGKPMIVSTGMSTYEEIDRTYEMLAATGVPLALMNCVSEYPPQYQDINLNVIGQMITRYPRAIIGHSDHTPDLFTCYAAVALGARIIEKHVILDRLQPGPDQAVSIDFHQLATLVEGIRKVEASLGSERSVHKKEVQIREWAFRSLVSTCAIPAGTTITEEMVWTKRPGTGIPAAQMPAIIGRKTKRAVACNTLFSWDDFEGEQ